MTRAALLALVAGCTIAPRDYAPADGAVVDAAGTVDASDDAAGPDAAIATCGDGVQGPHESDVDCGGECAPCAAHRRCATMTDCVTGVCVDARCALASGPPAWLPATPLPTLTGVMGAGLGDGAVWVVGRQLVASSSTGTAWTETASPLAPGMTDVAVVGDGLDVWAIGGRDRSDGERTSGVHALRHGAGWIALAPIARPRSSVAAAVGPDGKIYALGGSDNADPRYSNVVERYTPPPVPPASRTWDASPDDLPFGLFAAGAATVGDHLYVAGGTAASGALRTLLRWKPGDRAWSSRAELPAPRAGLGVAGAPDGRLYAVAGFDGSNVVARVDAYAPDADRWFAVAPLPGGARTGLGVTLGPDGRIWAIGGVTGAAPVGTVEIYGPVLRLEPERGPAGNQVQVTGSNFAANATVRVHVGSLASTAVGSSRTSAAGAMTTPVGYTVPADTPSDTRITIYAVDDRSQFPVHRVFTVN